MPDTPKIIQTDEQLAAVIHLIVTRQEISQVMGPAISEVLTLLASQGLIPAGACFSHHIRPPAETFDFEVGFPVVAPVLPAGRVKLSKLPAAKVARTIYRGGYEGLGAAWGEFNTWLEAAGLDTQDSLWECYTSGPESSPDSSHWCTELNRPLKS